MKIIIIILILLISAFLLVEVLNPIIGFALLLLFVITSPLFVSKFYKFSKMINPKLDKQTYDLYQKSVYKVAIFVMGGLFLIFVMEEYVKIGINLYPLGLIVFSALFFFLSWTYSNPKLDKATSILGMDIKKGHKKLISIILFITGIGLLIIGIVFFIMELLQK